MKLRPIISLSKWFKLALIVICLGILYMHNVWSDYFNPALSDEEQHNAVAAALDVDIRNDQGLTGLMFAAVYGEKELAHSLINKGAHLDLVSPNEKQTALHYATNNLRALNSAAVGYILIDAYANSRLANKFGQTPLHLVLSTDILEERDKMVDSLMRNGANINAQTNQGDTLLHLAVNMQAYNWVPLLLEKYGSIMSRSIKNKKGLTPKEYAIQLGYGDMANLVGDTPQPLVAPGAYDKSGLTGLMLAIMGNNKAVVESYTKDQAALNLLSHDEYRNSALHTAVVQENTDALKLLLAHGANSTISNAKGEPAIQYIVRVSDPNKKVAMLELFLKQSPSAILIQNNRGDNLIHYLARFDDQKSLEYIYRNYRPLLEQALTVKNKALETPEDIAIRLSHKTVIKVIESMKK